MKPFSTSWDIMCNGCNRHQMIARTWAKQGLQATSTGTGSTASAQLSDDGKMVYAGQIPAAAPCAPYYPFLEENPY